MTRFALIPLRSGALALATVFLFVYSVAVAAPASPSTAPRSGEDGKLVPIQGTKIWDQSRITDRAKTRMELTDLIRFKGNWYCSFREGEVHNNHPSGRVRIIRSSDGEKWGPVTLLAWDAGDVREVNFSITAEGHLMANTSVYFVRKQPRADGRWHQLESSVGRAQDESESGVVRQSVTWLSADGTNWSSAYACPTGINNWRWSVTWFNGMGYSVAHPGAGGRETPKGALYRTRDGKSWRLLKGDFFTDTGNEAALAFDDDGRATCLLRDGKDSIVLGVGQPPYYQKWEWRQARVDWQNDGILKPAKEVIPSSMGGPKLLRLRDGRLIGAGRGGGISLYLVDSGNAVMTRFATVTGNSYAGIAEHDGMIWVSYGQGDAAAIYLAKVNVPAAK
jgi:hypothetical protein